jgi:hypothetical protein
MIRHEHWIKRGQITNPPKHNDGSNLADRELLFKHDFVKVECNATGTSCKWVMFSANWMSLYFLKEFLNAMIGPFTLEFFNAGWFTERFETSFEARQRLDQLISKSDVRFSSRTFTRKFEPLASKMPATFRSYIEAGEICKTDAVYCSVEVDREQTQVEHIGENSALAKIWGSSPVSYPCRSGHSYDKVVSRSYFEVVKSNRPHYDHVLAAMVRPDGSVHWMGYQRLILPQPKGVGRSPTVAVACEFAPVDIPLL